MAENSVFDHSCYRRYLREHYRAQKEAKTGFTYASFSKKAGIRSPNYYKLVMDGEKNLTLANIARFARGLGLVGGESDYFEALVHFSQASNALEKDYYRQRLQRLKRLGREKARDGRTLEEYEFEAISNWLCYAIMVMTHLEGFREDPAWIREKLFDLVTLEEAQEILDRLIETRLLSRGSDGKLVQTHRQIMTKPELRRMSARIFYEGILGRAIQSLKLGTLEAREFKAFTVGLSPDQLPELKRRVREFMDQLNSWALENPNPTQVYSLLFCGFPLTRSSG